MKVGISYVVPIRCDDRCGGHPDLRRTIEQLRDAGTDVIVVDGSSGAAELSHKEVFCGVRHLLIEVTPGINGKVRAVHIGIAAAIHDRVIIADDDVCFEPALLESVAGLLEEADLVVPQNYFSDPQRWHTYWDTARTLMNRAFGHDYPGTLAVRRSMFVDMGGYDGNALFENLELIRTVRAAGGRVRWAPDLFVPRDSPSTSAFLRQPCVRPMTIWGSRCECSANSPCFPCSPGLRCVTAGPSAPVRWGQWLWPNGADAARAPRACSR
jgi:hypothetical protein